MPTIVHFEIPANDIERSKKFYTDLFGWKIEKWPGTGGIMKRQNPQQQITNFIDVKSGDEYASKIEKIGGKVVIPKMGSIRDGILCSLP